MFAAAGGFRGVGDAAPYVGGCPLTGGCANLRRGVGTPPYGCNSCKHCRGGHPLMGRSVGRGLDPSGGVCGWHGACLPPRGRGRACPARGCPGYGRRRDATGEGLAVGEGFIPPGMFAAAEGFRGVGDAAPYVGGCPLTGGCANLRRGVGTPPYGCYSRKHCRGGIYPSRCVCSGRRFPGRRGRRPLRGWLPVDGWPRELAAGCGHPALRMLFM